MREFLSALPALARGIVPVRLEWALVPRRADKSAL